MNEKELIKACQRGEKQAFDELIIAFYPYVAKFLVKTTADELLAEDLCQETFLKIIKNIDKYNLRGSAGFGTYIITVAKNTYVDYLRKNKEILINIDDIVLADEHNPENMTVLSSQYDELMKEIEKLPFEQKAAIKMKYVEQQTLKEIAKKFGVPEKTIKSRIHEGKCKLRKKLSKKITERND